MELIAFAVFLIVVKIGPLPQNPKPEFSSFATKVPANSAIPCLQVFLFCHPIMLDDIFMETCFGW